MEGLGLLRVLVESTGLPADAVEREITKLLAQHQIAAESVTLDDVRNMLSTYLQDALLEAKDALKTDAL